MLLAALALGAREGRALSILRGGSAGKKTGGAAGAEDGIGTALPVLGGDAEHRVTGNSRPANIEVLSWQPRAFLFRNFLSDEECEHFIEKARPKMEKSTVVDNKTGGSIASTIRTSSGTFFEKCADDIVCGVEERIADVSMVPMDNGEGLQILQYEQGQKYEPHYDFLHDAFNKSPQNGGQRIATMLMYLSDVEEGGHTVVPNSAQKPPADTPGLNECTKRGLHVKPRKGDALLFYSLTANGEEDRTSLHGACPVIRGVKWSATKWMHVSGFGHGNARRRACLDTNAQCETWASLGECDRNAPYMRGECAKACKLCV